MKSKKINFLMIITIIAILLDQLIKIIIKSKIFNSSIIYEPAVMKTFAQPLLLQLDKSSKFYAEARRLYEYLNNFLPMETSNIPIDSLIREFIGNGCFNR